MNFDSRVYTFELAVLPCGRQLESQVESDRPFFTLTHVYHTVYCIFCNGKERCIFNSTRNVTRNNRIFNRFKKKTNGPTKLLGSTISTHDLGLLYHVFPSSPETMRHIC